MTKTQRMKTQIKKHTYKLRTNKKKTKIKEHIDKTHTQYEDED